MTCQCCEKKPAVKAYVEGQYCPDCLKVMQDLDNLSNDLVKTLEPLTKAWKKQKRLQGFKKQDIDTVMYFWNEQTSAFCT
jgi:Zn-finger nucleic acid-binding protein